MFESYVDLRICEQELQSKERREYNSGALSYVNIADKDKLLLLLLLLLLTQLAFSTLLLKLLPSLTGARDH